MVQFQKRVKHRQQKWYHFRKGLNIVNENGIILIRKASKFLSKNGTISEEGQTSSTKMVPFQKRVKHRQQKWYHFRKGSNIVNENGIILIRKASKFLNKNGTISEKGQKSSTKMEPFQKRVKYTQQKWYHFSQKMIKIPQQKWYHFRKGSKILNKNGTILEKGQKSSTERVPFQKMVKIP